MLCLDPMPGQPASQPPPPPTTHALARPLTCHTPSYPPSPLAPLPPPPRPQVVAIFSAALLGMPECLNPVQVRMGT